MPGVAFQQRLQEVTRQPQTSTRTHLEVNMNTFMQQLRQQQLKHLFSEKKIKGALSRRRELIHIRS
ncbi:hypothetical protein SPFM15_00213 [Salmonella phage SPFM15]|nr:hypothetical protein SPFM5_00208 [Salmonella phage SPFM5]VFR13837.1 hypothetical protein SPFM15_00213 [Salmonella phage SPFM15]